MRAVRNYAKYLAERLLRPSEGALPVVRPPEPAPVLAEVHLHNARILPDRDHLLEVMPKGGTAAEVGVAFGDFSRRILDRMQVDRFVAIDIFTLHTLERLWGRPTVEWFGSRTHEQHYRERFAGEIAAGRVTVLVGDSAEQLLSFPEAHFDFIYIDADHTYEAVARDLAAAARTIKPTGCIVMNDYVMVDPFNGQAYGVIHATNEFCRREGWEIVYLALQPYMFCDVALRKF